LAAHAFQINAHSYKILTSEAVLFTSNFGYGFLKSLRYSKRIHKKQIPDKALLSLVHVSLRFHTIKKDQMIDSIFEPDVDSIKP